MPAPPSTGVAPHAALVRNERAAAGSVVGNLPRLADAAAADVKGDGDVLVQTLVVALGIVTMQRDRAVVSAEHILQSGRRGATRARDLPEPSEDRVAATVRAGY